MIDIESRVTESLHHRADRPIKVDGLRESATRRAGSIRRRRHALGALAATGIVAVIAAGIAGAPHLIPIGRSQGGTEVGVRPPPPMNPGPVRAPGPVTLREAAVDPAAANPGEVGTDPGLLHFDLDVAALKGGVSAWVSGAGYEGVALRTANGGTDAEVYLGPDAARLETALPPPGPYAFRTDGSRIPLYKEGPRTPVTVNGRPGTLQKITDVDPDSVLGKPDKGDVAGIAGFAATPGYAWVLRWQPVDGLHAVAQVYRVPEARAYAVAVALKLDRAQWCAVPVRLTAVPAGATVTECRTMVRRRPIAGRGVWAASQITYAKPDGTRTSVWLEDAKRPRHSHDTAQFKANRTVAGHPAQWRPANPAGLWILNFGPAEVFVSKAGERDREAGLMPEDEALRVARGLRITGDLANPESWQQRPFE